MNDVLHSDGEVPPTLRSSELTHVLRRALPDVRVVEAPARPEPELADFLEPARRTMASFIPRFEEVSALARWLSPIVARRALGLS